MDRVNQSRASWDLRLLDEYIGFIRRWCRLAVFRVVLACFVTCMTRKMKIVVQPDGSGYRIDPEIRPSNRKCRSKEIKMPDRRLFLKMAAASALIANKAYSQPKPGQTI